MIESIVYVLQQSYVRVIIAMIALGVSLRKLENSRKNKRSDDREAIYNRLGALELAASSNRSEIVRVEGLHSNLREGTILIETKADDAKLLAARADERSGTILQILKKKQ